MIALVIVAAVWVSGVAMVWNLIMRGIGMETGDRPRTFGEFVFWIAVSMLSWITVSAVLATEWELRHV
jgi:hypothetical protein